MRMVSIFIAISLLPFAAKVSTERVNWSTGFVGICRVTARELKTGFASSFQMILSNREVGGTAETGFLPASGFA